MITYKHFGDAGDIIASLPAVRALGDGLFYLEASTYTRVMMTPDNWRGIDKVLREQPYILDVREFDRRTIVSYNLNDWRVRHGRAMRSNQSKDKSLVDWQLEQYGIPLTAKDTAWLQFAEPIKAARVVFNRTGTERYRHHVYHNVRFPWHHIWNKYADDAVFIGTPDEHKVFCATCGEVPHYKTKDLHEAARVVAGCELFVGNQSCCYWIAEGLKKNLILEVWPDGPNSLSFRDGAIMGRDENIELPDLP
jgi:hypothetical protein